MLRKTATIYRGLLVSHSLVLLCLILIWDQGLGSREKSKMSPTCLVLVGWNILSVCFTFVNECVFWCVPKFCCKHGAEAELGEIRLNVWVHGSHSVLCLRLLLSMPALCVRRFLAIFLLSLLPPASSHHYYHKWFYGLGTESLISLVTGFRLAGIPMSFGNSNIKIVLSCSILLESWL